MEDQKAFIAKQVENLRKARKQSGELSDEELQEVAGGGVSETVAKAHCPVCNFTSRFYDPDNLDDCKIIAVDHLLYSGGCQNAELEYRYFG